MLFLKDDLKELYKYSLEHLAQFWKYVLQVIVFHFEEVKDEGPCQCKFVAGKITMLKTNLENVMIFKAAFILFIRRKFVKQIYVAAKRNIDLQQMKLNLRAVCLSFKYTYFSICF